MARSTRHTRPPFDPRCDFVYLKSLRVNNQPVVPGDPVDKTVWSPRRLLQLYEGRSIGYAKGSKPEPLPPKPLAVGPSDMAHYGEAFPPAPKRQGIARYIPKAFATA